MKRQKRDKSELIFSRGHSAGLSGKSREECPYCNPSQKQIWLNGWRKGRQHNWEGKKGVSSVSFFSNFDR